MDTVKLNAVQFGRLVAYIVKCQQNGFTFDDNWEVQNFADRVEACLEMKPRTDMVYKHDVQADVVHLVAALADSHRRSEAIRRYRDLANVGLKEAKEAIDSIRPTLADGEMIHLQA
jgi:ribosomal protein L7/L12